MVAEPCLPHRCSKPMGMMAPPEHILASVAVDFKTLQGSQRSVGGTSLAVWWGALRSKVERSQFAQAAVSLNSYEPEISCTGCVYTRAFNLLCLNIAA